MKVCSKCKIYKELKSFWKDSRDKNWIRCTCKDCVNKSHLKYKRTIPWLASWIYSTQLRNCRTRKCDKPTYSNEELKEWLREQDSLELLYNNWVESWFNPRLTPSIDRIDDYKWYSFDNIQLMTWDENNKKAHKDMREWRNNKQSKTIIWKNIYTGEKIEYYSITQAARKIWINRSSISRCVNWIYQMAWWCTWTYK